MRKISKALAAIFCMLMILTSVCTVSFAATKPAATKKITTTASATSIKLTWSKVSGASGYRVYQYKNKEWVAIKNSTTELTYTVKSLTPQTSYKFAVRTYKKASGKTYWSDLKQVNAKTTAFTDTKTLKGAADENCKVKLTWSKVSGATGYIVYVYKDKEWKKLKTTTDLTYTASGLDEKTTYKFKVISYAKISGKTYKSAGKTVSVKTGALSVGTVKDLKATSASDSIKLTWSGEGNIAGYRVYKLNSETGKYETLSTIKETSFEVTGLLGSTEYSFIVKPYSKSGSTTKWGAKYTINATTLISAPSRIWGTISDKTATISWTESNIADGYRVYIKNSGKYTTLLNSTKNTTYTLDLTENKVYELGVKAYKKQSDGSYQWSSMKEISVGGAYYYRSIFATGEYSYNTDVDGQITEVYHKNGSTQLKTSMEITEGVAADCKIIYNKSKDKTIAVISIPGFGGFYCTDMSAFGGDSVDMNDMNDYNVRFVDGEISSDITVTEVVYPDKTLITESFTNSKGETVIFYFENGQLVKHDIIMTSGKLDSLSISNIKSKVSDDCFEVRESYYILKGYINIDIFLQ